MRKLIILLLLASCQSADLGYFMGMPKPPTEGPPEYLLGWRQGCKTGMTAYTNSFYRSIYKTEVNPNLIKSPYYNQGWNVGMRYCSYYMSTYMSIDAFDNSNDKRSKARYLDSPFKEPFRIWAVR